MFFFCIMRKILYMRPADIDYIYDRTTINTCFVLVHSQQHTSTLVHRTHTAAPVHNSFSIIIIIQSVRCVCMYVCIICASHRQQKKTALDHQNSKNISSFLSLVPAHTRSVLVVVVLVVSLTLLEQVLTVSGPTARWIRSRLVSAR